VNKQEKTMQDKIYNLWLRPKGTTDDFTRVVRLPIAEHGQWAEKNFPGHVLWGLAPVNETVADILDSIHALFHLVGLDVGCVWTEDKGKQTVFKIAVVGGYTHGTPMENSTLRKLDCLDLRTIAAQSIAMDVLGEAPYLWHKIGMKNIAVRPRGKRSPAATEQSRRAGKAGAKARWGKKS
jgi:hypothetical protein